MHADCTHAGAVHVCLYNHLWVCVCVCVPGGGLFWSLKSLVRQELLHLPVLCSVFERSLGRWGCREGQACCSLWARLYSTQHVYSSFTNPPRPYGSFAWGGTPEEPCQCSVVLLELGYKVKDQSKRFERCGVCLGFECSPLRVFLSSLSFYSISGFCVIVLWWQGWVSLCSFEKNLSPVHLLKNLMVFNDFSLSCFLTLSCKMGNLYIC